MQYLVPSRCNSLTITVTSSLTGNNGKYTRDLSVRKDITLEYYDDKDWFFKIYLRKLESEYAIQVLGKNGEPTSHKKVEVRFKTDFLTDDVTATLETDVMGQVYIGDCASVTKVFAKLPGNDSDAAMIPFVLKSPDLHANLPAKFELLHGETLELPAQSGCEFSEDTYKLYKVSGRNASCIENFFHKMKQVGSLIVIEGLPFGNYELGFQGSIFKDFKICIYKGQRWAVHEQYLERAGSIMQVSNQKDYIMYDNLTVDNASKKLKLKVVSKDLSNSRVHVLGYNYFPESSGPLQEQFGKSKVPAPSRRFDLENNQNIFLNSKEIGDESQYVLERKMKKSFMGNTLAKPSFLTKRFYNKDTAALGDNTKHEGGYAAKIGKEKDQSHFCDKADTRGTQVREFKATKINGFLNHNGHSVFNCIPDANSGQLEIDLEQFYTKGMNFITVVIEDSRSTVSENYCLTTSGEVQKRSVALKESRESGKVYHVNRFITPLKPSQSITIKDFSNTDMRVLGDLNSLFKILQTFLTKDSPDSSAELSRWKFLLDWPSLDFPTRLKKYDEFMSHEINLFIYYHDQPFFNKVSKILVQNKAEKTLVDYFL